MNELSCHGGSGFIGFHLCMKLIKNGIPITGFDNFNSYYDPNLKRARIQELQKVSLEKNVDFKLITGDLSDKRILKQIFLKLGLQGYSFSRSSGC